MKLEGHNQDGMPEYSFKLQCKVKRIWQTFQDKKPDGSLEQRNVEGYLLIPRIDTTETTLFFNQYLEDLLYREDVEFVAIIGYPIAKEVRLSFIRPSVHCPDQAHFYVMTVKIQDDQDVVVVDIYKMLSHLDGREIEVETLTDSQEEEFNV